MGIRQLNGTYVPAEDRILLRITTDAAEEFRFWLTRPITGQLLGAINAAAERAIAQKFPAQVAQTVAEFEQQAVKAQTKLDDQFQPGATFPLGEAPGLVVKLGVGEKGNDISLDLTMPNGASINLCIPPKLAQQIGVLLDGLQQKATWGIAQSAAPASAAAPDAASNEKKLMH